MFAGRQRDVEGEDAAAVAGRPPVSAPDFLGGGGEMGALVRAYDWAASPLGAPQHWPQSLRTTVRILLTSNHPMFIWWGPELIQIYNDAYRQTLGPERHPSALGQRGRECWQEIWPVIGPQIELVMSGGGSTWNEDQLIPLTRHGKLEQVWWTYGYSPIDDGDTVGGVLVICRDVTGEHLRSAALRESEQRLRRDNEDLFIQHEVALDDQRRLSAETNFLRHIFEQAPSFMTVLRGPDHVFEIANESYLRLLGRRDIIGKTIRDTLPEVDGQGFFELLDNVYRTGQPFVGRDSMVGLKNPETGKIDRRYLDFVYQPILDANGAVQGIFVEGVDVTERKAADEARRDSEEQFRNLADNMSQFAWTADATGAIYWYNKQWYDYTGTTFEQMQGWGWKAVQHPDHLERVVAHFQHAIAEGAIWEDIFPLRGVDGSYRWFLSRAQPIQNDAGVVVRWFGTNTDITERVAAEDMLREREAELARVQEIGQIGGLEVDVRHGYHNRRRSPEYLRIHGLTEASAYEGHEDWLRRVHPDDRDEAEQELQAAVRGQASEYVSQYRIVRPSDDQVRWISVRAEIERDAAGHPQRLIGAHADITDQVMAANALRESEELFRTLAEALPHHVWTATPDGKLDWFNHRVYDYTGAAAGDLDGDAWAKAVLPEDVPVAMDSWARALRDTVPYDVEFRLRQANGDYRWFLARAVPVWNENGVIRWIGTNTDVHDKRLISDELERLNATLEERVVERTQALRSAEDALRQSQKMEAVGQLTGGIAHDFNNLLQGIVGSLDLVQRRIDQGRIGDIARLLGGAMASANRAAALTHRLLAFSRRQPLDPKPVNANPLVLSMEELLQRTLGETTELKLDLAGDLWLSLCDPPQLENAVLNLAINARDAMPDGGKLTIKTRNVDLENDVEAGQFGVAPGQYVCISVRDTGVGMAADVIERAFDPFFTTKPIGQGTGLGLSMIYGFVRQSEGGVNIASEPGVGTTMRICLPRYHGADVADAGGNPNTRKLESDTGETVLVVEDEVIVRGLILEVLSDLGYHALEAPDGPSGLEILQSNRRIDLLVTDIGLPGLNGRQLVDAARVQRPHLKVLFMTGYAENATLSQGFLEHGMEMITKPFPIETMAQRIRAMIEAS